VEVVNDVAEESRANSRANRAQTRRDEGAQMAITEKKLDLDCYNCGKHRHYARDCLTEKKVEGKTN
jgi:hypothetical protein